jgi:hypothetical protein
MQDDTEQKYNDLLASLGLSQEKIDYIRHANSDKKASKLYVRGSIACIVLMMVCMVGYLFIAHTIFFDYFMNERTQGVSYIFYDSLWMTHVVPMSFLGILLPIWALYKLLDYFPKASALIALESLDDVAYHSVKDHDVLGIWKFSRWCFRKLIDGNFHNMPIEQGLDYLNRKSRKWTGMCMVPPVLIALPLMVLDGLNYKLVTKEGVIERGYASFKTTKKSWSDVIKVETGCYFNKNLALTYTIMFNDGSGIDLFEAKSKEDKIIQIRTVDNVLRQLEKPFSIKVFTHGIHSGDPYVNDACFSKLREWYPNQYSEVISLLRLEKHSANQ